MEKHKKLKYPGVGVTLHFLVYAVVTYIIAVYPKQLPFALLLAINFESIYLIALTFKSNQRLRAEAKSYRAKLPSLWDAAHKEMRSDGFARAEKALLAILKIDERNAAAYNRLGILYAKQKEYRDAIDCFEIAASIEPTASALHNLGLIYYEVGNYKKSKQAFEEALELQDNLAARHIAYSKVLEKLDQIDASLSHLKKAYELDKSQKVFELLYGAYKFYGKHKELADLLKTHAKTHPADPLIMYKYGMKQISEAVEREQEAVDAVLARHGI